MGQLFQNSETMKLLLVFFIFYKVMRNLGSSCEENIDCLVSEDGASYNGTLSTTESGNPCEPWNGRNGLSDNYCRNPDGDSRVWCFTNPIGSWEYCDVKMCSDCNDGVSGSFCQEHRCGIGGETRSRIIGGSVATPHEFPWMVLLHTGSGHMCGGALVSPRVVLSAFHCQYDEGKLWKNGTAILGAHRNPWSSQSNIRIPYNDVRHPKHPHKSPWDPFLDHQHDFLLIVLDKAAKMSDTVKTICLPPPNSNYGGSFAVAAGWGRFAKPDVNENSSRVLRKVTLEVSPKVYRHSFVFGTLLKNNSDGEWMDPCSGDSGGPLMHQNKKTKRWTLIGTVIGGGYNCGKDEVNTPEGWWNKVSSHSIWLKRTMEDLDEPICRDV